MTIGGAHVSASFLDPSAKQTVNTGSCFAFLVILSIYQSIMLQLCVCICLVNSNNLGLGIRENPQCAYHVHHSCNLEISQVKRYIFR